MNRFQDEPVVKLLQNLIRTRSYSGEEGNVVSLLKNYFEEHGFDKVCIDKMGNIIGVLEGDHPGPTYLFDGHIDTVPVQDPETWKHDPFGAVIEDGRMYGRGTSDMKGAVAAMVCAAAAFKKETQGHFAGRVCVAGVVHEECFEGVAAREISRAFQPDLVVIGEASELNLKIGQRGRMEIKVETYGKPAHSSNPEKGLNAVYSMCKVIEALKKLSVPESAFLGKGILELTDIRSEPWPGASVVPEKCTVTYDRRLLTGETVESVLASITAVLDDLAASDPSIRAKAFVAEGHETCYTGEEISGQRFFPAWEYDPEEPFVRAVFRALRGSRSDQPEPTELPDQLEPTELPDQSEPAELPDLKLTHYSFCTNGSHYAGEAQIPTVGFGPSREDLAHTIDEYIELSDLIAAEGGYKRIMELLTV